MSNSAALNGYLHIEGFDQFFRNAFDKKPIRAGMRKVGRLVARRTQTNLALASGATGYPRVRTGRLRDSVSFKVSRSGFMVKVAHKKTGSMSAFYPAFLHYGVKAGGHWRINPRKNYVVDALQDSSAQVQQILSGAFAAGLR